ncbi:MAG: NAD(P)-binding protein [Pseudomonadota bacterium]
MSTSYYDIVVVGTDLSGLVFAAQAARAGYRTLVLGHEGRPGTYPIGEAKGLRELPLLYGFETSNLLRGVFRDLGLYHEMRNRPERADPYFQAVTAKAWYSHPGDPDLLDRELAREFPGREREIRGFLKRIADDNRDSEGLLEVLPPLPAVGWGAGRHLRKVLRAHDAEDRLGVQLPFPDDVDYYAVASGLAAMMAPMRPKPINPFTLSRLLHHAHGGFYHFPGGMDGFRQLFVGRITSRGGTYRPQAAVSSILLNRRLATDIRLARGQERISYKMLVCNSSPRRFFDRIPPELQSKKAGALLATLEPAYARYVVNLVVDPELLPDAFGRHLLLITSARKDLVGTNLLWLVRTDPEAGAEPGSRATISAFCHIPVDQLPGVEEGFDDLNRRILRAVQRIAPFLTADRVEINTPYLARNRESGKLVLDPVEVREIYDTPHEGTLDLSPVPFQTEYKNILILGDAACSALGLEGALLAARHATEWARSHIKLKKVKGA